MTFICYPKCTTCQKAQKWLDENGISYTFRDIKMEHPTYNELTAWHRRSGLPLKKFFNTSGLLYKSMALKEKLSEMSEDEITKWEEKAKRGVLYNDSTVSTVMSQMRSALYTSVTLDDGSKFGIYNLGIKTSSEWSEHGKLQIDENAFDKAFENNEDAIIKLFTDSDTGMMKKLNSVIDGAVKSSGAANTRGTLVRKAGKADSSVTIPKFGAAATGFTEVPADGIISATAGNKVAVVSVVDDKVVAASAVFDAAVGA